MNEVVPSTRMEEIDPLRLSSFDNPECATSAGLKNMGIWQRARGKLSSAYSLSAVQEGCILESNTETTILASVPRFVIIPDSKLKIIWNGLLSLILLYAAIVSPLTMAFNDSNTLDAWELVDLFIDFFFFLDLIVNSTSAYIDCNSNLVTDRKKILLNYLKSWFIIDLLSCIPFSMIAVITQNKSNQTNRFFRFIRLPRLYKLLRMSRLLKMLNGNSNSEVAIKIQDFLSIKQSATRFISSIATILIAVHIIACMWYFSSKLDDFNPDTWVVRYNYSDSDKETLYITSVYWAFTTLTTVGYGDLSPNTIAEKVIAVIWMLAGLYFLGFTIGSLSTLAASIDTKEKILSKKLAAIDEFITDTKLNKTLAHKLRFSLKYSSKITGFSWVDKQTILNELPKNLKYEISMAMYRGAARHISFFVDKKSSLISSIVPFLTPVAVMITDSVYKQEDFADEMYFLIKGTVEYFYNDEYLISTINMSDYFGDIEVIFQIPRKYSARAKRNLELLSMNRTTLSNIKKEYFCVWDEIRVEAVERDRRNGIHLARMLRKTNRNLTKTYNVKINAKNKVPSLTDISEQVINLFELADSYHKKLEKMQKVVNTKRRLYKYYSDDEH